VAQVFPTTIQSLYAGVAPAMAMLAGLQLDVFTALGSDTLSVEELASRTTLPPDRLSRLLAALVAAGLLVRVDGMFANSDEAREFFVKGSIHFMGSSHELTSDLWKADLNTAESIRSGSAAAEHDFTRMNEAQLLAFLRGLQASARSAGKLIGESIHLQQGAMVIDIGGGSGATLEGLLAVHPTAHGTLMELSRVADAAATLTAQAGPSFDIIVCDICQSVPAGKYDAAIMRAVLQVLSPVQSEKAIQNSFELLKPGGSVHITGGGILNDDCLGPVSAVYFDVTLMNLYPQGASRTLSQHKKWLAGAGFINVRVCQLDNGSQLLSADKPV
jgi:cyclopropane fatty-acyl-phospholipid synthase-like methyltransferase